MEFKNLIGQKLEEAILDSTTYTIENNEFELELEEGFSEEWHVKSNDSSYQMILDSNRVIQTIFLFANQDNIFPIREFHKYMGRKEIRKIMGVPSKSADVQELPILGMSFGFDRYDKEIVYHFEYENEDQSQIKKITLMALGTAP